MTLDKELKEETEKWLKRIKAERKKIALIGSKKDFLRNIDAYISDSEHFLQKNDLIRAFEAVIWSWANLELGLQLNILKQIPTRDPDYLVGQS